MSFLTQLNWRYATKKFDTSKKVSDEQLAAIQNAIKMAPTSFGLQPFHVVVVSNPELKTKLRAVSWDQSQVTDASHVLVFCARTDVLPRVGQYFTGLTQGNAEIRASLKGYEDMMTGFASGLDAQTVHKWATYQAYIALGFAMAACAEIEVDSCPMEGFDRDAYNTILELPENMKAQVILPIGFRAADDIIRPKFRFDDIFETRA